MLWVLIRSASGTSNEYPQHMFSWRNETFQYFSVEKSALSGVMIKIYHELSMTSGFKINEV